MVEASPRDCKTYIMHLAFSFPFLDTPTHPTTTMLPEDPISMMPLAMLNMQCITSEHFPNDSLLHGDTRCVLPEEA